MKKEMEMKTLKFLVVALGLVVAVAGQSAMATTHKEKAKHAVHSNTDAIQHESGNPIYLQPGIGFISGAAFGVTLNASAAMRVSKDLPIYAGLDTFLALGANYSYWNNGYTSSSVGVGLLGTAFYKFTFPKRQRMHIIGGLSTGPFIGGGLSFALLVRPGFTWDMSETMSISAEPVSGIIGGGWVFLPRALLTFKI